jgi:hypothetical protein
MLAARLLPVPGLRWGFCLVRDRIGDRRPIPTAPAACAAGRTADTDACAQALDDAAELFRRRTTSPIPAPSWAYWVSEAVLVADAGRAWLEAGLPDRAEPLLTTGLMLFGESQPRNRLLHGISLAQCRLLAGAVDGAVHATDSALALVGPRDSARARSRLRELRAALASSGSNDAIRTADRIGDLVHA